LVTLPVMSARLNGLFSLLVALTAAFAATSSAVAAEPTPAAQPNGPGVVRNEFIYTEAPFPQCHASTIVETPQGLVASWFGGTKEGHEDVTIWVSRYENGAWTAPQQVADGVQSAALRYPCWNPVLFQPAKGPLMLFFKVGPNPMKWWGEWCVSHDGGRTWSKQQKLGEVNGQPLIGPVKNKPIQLADGTILCPSSTEHDGWRVHFERTADLGKSWQMSPAINDGRTFNAIQPSVLTYPDGRMQVLCRTKEKVVSQSWSTDGGKTWSEMTSTGLPNPNSGTDAVTLADGRQLLVYNHTVRGGDERPRNREMLNVAVSSDGRSWQAALVLENEPGEFSYPAVIQSANGLVHITYTWKRQRVKHVVLDPAKLQTRAIVDGKWPQ